MLHTIGPSMGARRYSPAMEPTTAARVLVVAISGLFGLLVGSFLNVVIYRVPRGMSVVRPPSHCPNCDTELKAADNVPLVSWLVLRGKCRYCRTPISVRYPIVELLTGLSFAAVAWALGSLDPLPSLLIVVAASLAAVAIDLDGLPIPWSVDLAAGIGAGSLIVVAAAVAEPTRIGWAALGGGASAVVALLSDRTDRGARRACIIATLGWSSSWLWAPGGLVLAGWALLVASAVAIGQRTSLTRANEARVAGVPAGTPAQADTSGCVTSAKFSLVAMAICGFGLVLVSSALSSPF